MLGLGPEETAAAIVAEWFGALRDPDSPDEPQFLKAVTESIEQNRSLLRRLADLDGR